MNQVPRTFCVTLKETPQRKEEASKYFEEKGLKVEFFDGIHGESFGLKTTIPNYEVIPGREYFIPQGAVGCILSHVMLWNVLQHQPEEEFLILEDDVLLTDDFFTKFEAWKTELPSDWDICFVGWSPAGNEYKKSATTHITENIVSTTPVCTHAYMVKKSALKILIETNNLAWDALDHQILKRSLPKMKHYAFSPPLINQRSVTNINLKTELWHSLCYDWAMAEVLTAHGSDALRFGAGWHPLEKNENEGYMIWSDGRGELIFDDPTIYSKMEIEFISEGSIDKKMKIICPSQSDQVFELSHGLNKIGFNINGAKSVILVSDTFRPIDVYKTSDCRRLGIRLLRGIKLTTKDEKTEEVSLYSMYSQKKIEGIAKVEGMRLTRVKYSHSDGKINLHGQTSFNHHRSGWGYTLGLLSQFHRADATVFDGWLEKNFAWQKNEYSQMRLIPYREPWVGVFHNPPNTPSWFSADSSPSAIINSREFQDSLPMCKGLYTLSKYHADFLKCFLKNVPIETFYHPTEIPDLKFSFDKFVDNNDKKVVNIGWWLRKLTSIYRLETDPAVFQKIRLVPPIISVPEHILTNLIEVEGAFFKRPLTEEMQRSVIDVRHMANEDYDDLLSKNIVFLDMYDASANNAIIECMARRTPVLVNPLPAVVEYLGPEYPFYFTGLEDASKKLKNVGLIKATHEYLTSSGVVEKITGDYCLNTIRNGAIWKSLP
jgi:GR25 family glycosyltransferase involved in LPS biosynthesis